MVRGLDRLEFPRGVENDEKSNKDIAQVMMRFMIRNLRCSCSLFPDFPYDFKAGFYTEDTGHHEAAFSQENQHSCGFGALLPVLRKGRGRALLDDVLSEVFCPCNQLVEFGLI